MRLQGGEMIVLRLTVKSTTFIADFVSMLLAKIPKSVDVWHYPKTRTNVFFGSPCIRQVFVTAS